MNNKLHKVALVFELNFDKDLENLSSRLHVWLLDTPENRKKAEQIWERDYSKNSLEKGITLFSAYENETLEDACINIMETIFEHHGEYAHSPPMTVLEVYGLSISNRIKQDLEKYGFVSFISNKKGFICYMPLVTAVL